MPKFEQPRINQENLNDGLEYPTENEAGFDGLVSGENPDLIDDGEKPKETSAENKLEKTEQVAREKLEILKNPEFKEFAIRFMTKDEYETMMRNGHFTQGEVHVFNEANGNSVSFSDYFNENKGDWRRAIYRQTEWSHGNADLDMADEFLKLLREAHKKQRQESPDDKIDIRAKTLLIFRDKLANYLAREFSHSNAFKVTSESAKVYDHVEDLRFNEDSTNLFKKIYESPNPYEEVMTFANEKGDRKLVYKDKRIADPFIGFCISGLDIKIDTRKDIDKINADIRKAIEPGIKNYSPERLLKRLENKKKIYGDQYENFEIVKNFFSNPEWINEDKDNLRKLFDALIYIKQQGKKREDSQYHIGIVIDLPAVLTGLVKGGLWGLIKTKGDEEYDQSKHILGAVALMPDKKLIEQMELLSSQAGSLAHPVFDRNGHVMYPRHK